MGQRNERGSLLRREHAGHLGRRQHVAFRQGLLDQLGQCVAAHAHRGDGHRLAACGALLAHVDHGNAAGFVEMRKVVHDHLAASSSSSGVLTFISGSPRKVERNVSSSMISASAASPRSSKRPAAIRSSINGSNAGE